MSTIDIHAHHTLSHEDALKAANELSIDLAEKFGIEYGWEDEVIHFERPGVNGQILVQDSELRIQAKLGFMLMMLKGPIEQEIVRYQKGISVVVSMAFSFLKRIFYTGK